MTVYGQYVTEVTNTLNFTADISGILGVGVGGAFDPASGFITCYGIRLG